MFQLGSLTLLLHWLPTPTRTFYSTRTFDRPFIHVSLGTARNILREVKIRNFCEEGWNLGR